jgi:iron(III) transport system permease protein
MKSGRLLRLLPGMPALALVLPPLLWLLGAAALMALGPSGWPDWLALGLFGRSLQIGALATGLAVLIGLPYGWLTARYRFPGRRVLLLASLWPLFLPPYAGSHAWSILLMREGALNRALTGWGLIGAPLSPREDLRVAALVLGSCYWPLIAWMTFIVARSVPRELEDAARLQAKDAAAARWTAWPALRRALPAAALLVFLLALADFGVPNSIGVATYPVEIVRQFQVAWSAAAAVRLALPVLLLVIPLVWLQLRLLDRTALSPAAFRDTTLLRSPALAAAGACFCVSALALTVLVPLGTLIAYSMPLRTYAAVWAESSDHLFNTLLTAGGGALLTVILALGYGWTTRGRGPRVLDLALTLPYALPASLIGVAMIQLLNQPEPNPLGLLYTSMGALLWTYAALFFPFAHKVMQPAWAQLDPGLLDEGALAGVSGWAQFRTVDWPVLRPYAGAAAALVALLAAREMDAPALLRVPDGDTIAFRINDYLHFAPGPNLAALCVLLVVLSAVLFTPLAAWIWRHLE